MNLEFTPEEVEFRKEVRAFIEENYPKHLRGVGAREDLGKDDMLAWHQILGEKGWSVPAWPEKYGGTGWTEMQKYIWTSECTRYGTPNLSPMGLRMCGPMLMKFGTKEQKDHYLPRILSGEDYWCQGYSEPGAGSDLANVQTRAEREGDDLVIHGQKVWTSGAEWSDWCFVLCRTDPEAQPKHRGLSYVLCPMDQDGIDVRPIVQMTGDAEFSEVFYNGARARAADVVGGEGGGWRLAAALDWTGAGSGGA